MMAQVAWVYTVVIAVVFGGLAGLTQRILGSPGDLPETIKYIHKCGAIPARQAPSMFICSAFSITAGDCHPFPLLPLPLLTDTLISPPILKSS